MEAADNEYIGQLEQLVRVLCVRVAENERTLNAARREIEQMCEIFAPKSPRNSAEKELNRNESIQLKISNKEAKKAKSKKVEDNSVVSLVFHGVGADWIETEMAEDKDFSREVLALRLKTIMSEQLEIKGEVEVLDAFRYSGWERTLNDVEPVVAIFARRQDKERVLSRSRDRRLRLDFSNGESEVIVTDDPLTWRQ